MSEKKQKYNLLSTSLGEGRFGGAVKPYLFNVFISLEDREPSA